MTAPDSNTNTRQPAFRFSRSTKACLLATAIAGGLWVLFYAGTLINPACSPTIEHWTCMEASFSLVSCIAFFAFLMGAVLAYTAQDE